MLTTAISFCISSKLQTQSWGKKEQSREWLTGVVTNRVVVVDNAERLDARSKLVARVCVDWHEGDGAIAVVFTEYVHADLLGASSSHRDGNCSAECGGETDECLGEHFVLFLGIYWGACVYGYLYVSEEETGVGGRWNFYSLWVRGTNNSRWSYRGRHAIMLRSGSTLYKRQLRHCKDESERLCKGERKNLIVLTLITVEQSPLTHVFGIKRVLQQHHSLNYQVSQTVCRVI